MAGIVLVAVEGVLRSPQGQPIPEGVKLYHALKGAYKIVLAAEEANQDQVERWLQLAGLRDHAQLVCADVARADGELRYEQLRHLTSVGLRPQLIVDPSPARCATAVTLGYTTLLFTEPKYARPEWRPDDATGRRAWADIEKEVITQAEKHARDPRVDAEMTPG